MREFENSEGNDRALVREEKFGGVTRREFLELGVAATLAAGAGEIAWAADTKSEVPRRTSFERRWIAESIFWTTVGTTTAARAKSAWVRRCATGTGSVHL